MDSNHRYPAKFFWLPLSVSAHHHSRHRVRTGDIWRQDKGSPAFALRIGLPEPLPKLDVVAVERMPLPRRTALPARQCSGDLAYRLLMLLVPDFGKVARDLELHTLVRHDLPRTFFPDTFVKIGDRHAQRAADLK